MTVKNYVLDINKTSLQHPSIVLREDDYNIYTVNISVTDNGTPVDLGSYTLNFLGITPAGAKIIDSKNFITNAGDLKNGKFSYRFPKEAAGSKGVYDVAYFRLSTTSGATSTIDLNLRVLGGINLTADDVKDYITVDDTLRNALISEVFKKVDAKVDQHLSTVKKGDTGATGPTGPRGATGATGPAGKDGVVDYSKTINTTGDQSATGTKSFTDVNVSHILETNTLYKHVTSTGAVPFLEIDDTNIGYKQPIGHYYSSGTGGGGITLGAGGLTIVGSGESAKELGDVINDGLDEASFPGISLSGAYSENTIIAADYSIYFVPGQKEGYPTFDNTFRFSYDGYLERYTGSGWETLITPTSTLLAQDSQVVHNTGNETVAGNKTLTGLTTILTGNYGFRVTSSGFEKTTDGGKTWVTANL